MIGSSASVVDMPLERAEARVEAAVLVDRRDHRQPVDAPSSKSSVPAPGAMWTMPVPSPSSTSSHGITRCADGSCAGSSSNGPVVLEPDELLAADDPVVVAAGLAPGATRRSRARSGRPA